MKQYLVPPVNKPVRKPILYWQASNGETNNSIALLRHKYGNSVTYKAIR